MTIIVVHTVWVRTFVSNSSEIVLVFNTLNFVHTFLCIQGTMACLVFEDISSCKCVENMRDRLGLFPVIKKRERLN